MNKQSFGLKIKQINEDDDEKVYRFEGYASTFGNEDRVGDVVQAGAFKESLGERTPKMLYQHSSNMPIGSFTEVREDGNGLFVRGIIPKTFEKGREVGELMKVGAIDAMSIGYRVIESTFDEVRKVNLLEKLALFEISLVTFPANEMATVTGIKSVVPYQDLPIADIDTEWDSKAAGERLKTFLDTDDGTCKEYSKAFLLCDKEDSSKFDAYKMQIADVIDNSLVAVPRAVFAAAAALRGARGGIDVPKSGKDGLIANVKRYYEKMGLDDPFEKGFSGFIEGLKNIRDVENFLKDFGFSNQESKTLLSKMKDCRDDKSSKDRDDSFSAVNSELKKLNQLLEKNK